MIPWSLLLGKGSISQEHIGRKREREICLKTRQQKQTQASLLEHCKHYHQQRAHEK